MQSYAIQAIHTKLTYDINGNRIVRAKCDRGRIRRHVPDELSSSNGFKAHQYGKDELLAKFAKEGHAWEGEYIGGAMPDGSMAWVCLPK